MPGTASISGVISGMKTDEIIAKMMELAKAPVSRLQAQKSRYQARMNAWQEINTRVLALKTKASSLANASSFNARSASSSDEDILTVSATTSAAVGTYFFKVNATAKTHQIAMQGFADTNSTAVGTGTITIGAGSAGQTAVGLLAGTVDSVTLASDTSLQAGSQTLVVDAVATSATQQMTGTYAGADEAAARTQDAGAAGSITINGVGFDFDDSATLGSVVDAINARSGDTGVTASITVSADNWHVTLTQQTHGSDRQIAYSETAAILNGGSANDYTVAGTNALGHIGDLVFDQGAGDTLESTNGDVIVLNSSATTGTWANAFEITGGTAITIDSSNNTLAGLRDAINNADAGVTATIINDGSATAPYRLVVTSKTSGTAGEITVNTDHLTGGTAPVFSTLQAAQDASLTLGDGAGAITVTKSSNTITDLISGVTLNLKSSDTETTVTVKIEQDTTAAKQAIKDFVDQYNNLISYVNPQFKYNATSKTSGALFADSRLQTLLSDLRSSLFNPVTGLDQSLKVMSQIGITSTTDDKLQLDESKLDAALADNFDQVMRLFAKTGQTSSSSVSYVSATSKTQPSGSTGYAIDITQVATQAYVTAGGQQTSGLAQGETLTLNGVTIQLSVGMTQSQVITKINEYGSQTGVTASSESNRLTLRRNSYGMAGHIAVSSSVSANTNPGANSGIGNASVTETDVTGELGTGTGAAGLDVQGTINGEAATGSGQYLTGNKDNLTTEGLRIRFTGATTGSFGTLVFTRGLAGVISDYADNATTVGTGVIAGAKTSLEEIMDGIDDDIARLQERLAAQEARLIAQFSAMEDALGKLQNQGQYLAAQLA